MAFTAMDAVLFALIAFVQAPGEFPDARFVIVIVVAPELPNADVEKLPDPAAVTVIVAVEPEAVLAPLKL
jgi:hypothetical protein